MCDVSSHTSFRWTKPLLPLNSRLIQPPSPLKLSLTRFQSELFYLLRGSALT